MWDDDLNPELYAVEDGEDELSNGNDEVEDLIVLRGSLRVAGLLVLDAIL